MREKTEKDGGINLNNGIMGDDMRIYANDGKKELFSINIKAAEDILSKVAKNEVF